VGRRRRRITLVKGGGSVDAHRRSRVAHTCFEDARVIVGGYVPRTTEDVVNVFAEPGSIRPISTCSETELVVADEQRPFMHLSN